MKNNFSKNRLGLIFSYDEHWIGGTYYSINLIESLNTLTEENKPEVVVFSNETDFSRLSKETNYRYLSYELLNGTKLYSWQFFFNKISARIFKRSVFKNQYQGSIDALFLFQQCAYLDSIPMCNRVYWIPDLQEKHLPHFFTNEQIDKRNQRNQWIAQNASNLILSSNSVFADWKLFYPKHSCKVSVVHFAVTHPKYEQISISELRHRYNLPKIYFFAPNQFWAHKNHMTLIKAAQELKNNGTPVVVVFSGKEYDYRNLGYTESLKEYVKLNELEDVVRFLGFLDRAEQLQLMNHAKSIVQPSLFEGWSTVIEDAMAMNKQVIAADIVVNREQLGGLGLYFKTLDYLELAQIILNTLKDTQVIDYNYRDKLEKFAQDILKAFNID